MATSFVSSLRTEIERIARKQVKEELQSVRKATVGHRAHIAALKRQLKALASELHAVRKQAASQKPAAPADVSQARTGKRRGAAFSAERFAALRAKLGVSQAQMAQLLGASALSVHKWEKGATQPRAAQREKIFEAMQLGKREAARRLAE